MYFTDNEIKLLLKIFKNVDWLNVLEVLELEGLSIVDSDHIIKPLILKIKNYCSK